MVQHRPTFSTLGARLPYFALGVGTIVLGLVVHLRGHALGSAFRDITGDALWAAMVTWLAGAAAPSRGLGRGLLARRGRGSGRGLREDAGRCG